jgi:peptidyl-prolyl cis-trans isomerase C
MSSNQISATLLPQILLAACLVSLTAAKSAIEQEREDAKPWYTRDTRLAGGYSLPISPVSLAAMIVGFYQFYRVFTVSSWCEASHILVEDHTEGTKQMLEDAKRQIKDDPAKFAEFAMKISSCPSKSGGGSLGRFKPGTMAPQFDKACFDKDALIKKTIGPVQTSFGWHLLFIQDRKLV